MNSELFAKSVELMVIGMGMTFSFLILLVFMLKLLTWTVGKLNKVFPEVQENIKPAVPSLQYNTKIKIAVALAAIKAAK